MTSTLCNRYTLGIANAEDSSLRAFVIFAEKLKAWQSQVSVRNVNLPTVTLQEHR